ncbi:MAG: hypothetical protein HC869_10210, partial [Rhodospirillales bacterium]|nr:hypothetical protein [Rhodospirillales bacterium]
MAIHSSLAGDSFIRISSFVIFLFAAALLIRALLGRFGNCLQAGQALFELVADHLVHVHEEAKDLAHEVVFARHRPGDFGFVLLGLERKDGVAGVFHRLHEVQLEADKLTRA